MRRITGTAAPQAAPKICATSWRLDDVQIEELKKDEEGRLFRKLPAGNGSVARGPVDML